MSRPRLGRGLAALIPSDILDTSPAVTTQRQVGNSGALRMVPLDQVRPNPEQPRVRFSAAELENLAGSISEHGVITPLLVRRGEGGGYVLIAGERRLRAAGLAGRDEVPVWIREEVGDREQLLLALVENIQREDLDPMEMASAYQRLIDDFRMTQDQVARRVGKDRTTVANSVRLLKLLLSLSDEVKIRKALHKILDEGLSVRATERLVQGMLKPKRSRARLSPVYRHATALLTQAMGTKVAIEPRARGNRGRIVIDYYSSEDLTRLVDWLARTDQGV